MFHLILPNYLPCKQLLHVIHTTRAVQVQPNKTGTVNVKDRFIQDRFIHTWVACRIFQAMKFHFESDMRPLAQPHLKHGISEQWEWSSSLAWMNLIIKGRYQHMGMGMEFFRMMQYLTCVFLCWSATSISIPNLIMLSFQMMVWLIQNNKKTWEKVISCCDDVFTLIACKQEKRDSINKETSCFTN